MPNVDNIHVDKPTDQTSVVFHGINAVDPTHLLAEDEVQSSTNIDFTLEFGGAAVRRGSKRLQAFGTNTAILPSFLDVEFISFTQGRGSTDGVLFAGIGNNLVAVNGTTTSTIGTFSNTATGAGNGWVGTSYKGFGYFMGGNGFGFPAHVRFDGTTASDWITQSPSVGPTVTINTLTPHTIQGTLTASEGAAVGTTGIIFSAGSASFRLDVEQAVTANILASNGTHPIGDYGIVSVQLAFDEPKNVNRVSMDFGIGTSFNNYYHTELDVIDFENAQPDGITLIQSQVTLPVVVEGTTTTTVAADQDTKDEMINNIRTDPRPPISRISVARNTLNTWLIPKVNFETVFKDPNPGEWAQVGTARIVIEGTATFTATITNWQVAGAKDFPLNDVNLGYSWWETWATIDANTGVIYGESTPSPLTGPTKMQNVNVTLVSTAAPTGTHGITHRIYYRQGGFLNAPYAVGTIPLVTGTVTTGTFTDTSPDMDILALNLPMDTNIRKFTEFGGGARAAAIYYDRMFLILTTGAVGNANGLAWSLPGEVSKFPRTSQQQVGDNGDIGQALIPWLPRLVIVNNRNVYEMVGNFFEGKEADFVIARTGSRHGSIARLVAIKTPYGIPLIDYDGLYMYKPGAGIDDPLDWVMQKIGDMWRGTGATDPAGYKGSRVPAINFTNIEGAGAAYADNRLYLGLPTGTNTTDNDTLVVIDFRYQRIFLFQYPFTFTFLFWDQFNNKLMALTKNGNVMQLETGVTDSSEAGVAQGITFNWTSKAWPAPQDILTENIALQYRGGTSTVVGIYDSTNTFTVGTLATGSNRTWTIPTLGGTLSNDVMFKFTGTASGTQHVVYQLQWDNWIQPKKITYYRTDYDDGGTPLEKIWDVHYSDMQVIPGTAVATNGTVVTTATASSVLATAFVDNVGVSTFTLAGFNEKKRYEFAYPAETYGNIGFTIYQGGTSTILQGTTTLTATTTFKLYSHHNGVRQEPPRVTIYDSDRVGDVEQWWRVVNSDINPLGGTVTAVFMLDEVAQATFTMSSTLSSTAGTGRTVFPNAPQVQELYGKTAYVRYTSPTPFKHYRTLYQTEPQPDRVLFAESAIDTEPGVGVVKTWLFEANTLNGTVTGTLLVDNVAVTTATFSAAKKEIFNTSPPNITTGKNIKAVYSSTTPFKHHRTFFEIDEKPFYKKNWNVIFQRLRPPMQLDMGRFWQLDVETEATPFSGTNTATITSQWLVDGTAVLTNTYVLGTGTRVYFDRQSFPPGIFGYLFQQQIDSDQPIHLWSTTIDVETIGVKGFTRTSQIKGTPQEVQDIKDAAPVRQIKG